MPLLALNGRMLTGWLLAMMNHGFESVGACGEDKMEE